MPFSICVVLEPLMAKPENSISKISIVCHATYLNTFSFHSRSFKFMDNITLKSSAFHVFACSLGILNRKLQDAVINSS
jgi:hypothetical protein